MSILAAKWSAGAPLASTGYALTRFATISDQFLVAFTNFGLTLAIGRTFSHEDLASYGIGLSIGLMVQAIQRHALNIPLMLESEPRIKRRYKGILAEQLIVLACALTVGAIALAFAHFLDASRYVHLVVAASIVCLLVFTELEFARAFLVKLKRPWLLLATAFWYAAISAALIAFSLMHWIGFETLLVVLAAAMLIHYLIMVAAVGIPDPKRGLKFFVVNLRRYGGWAGIATATYAGYNHLPLLVLGVFTAPMHAAAFVATRSLMQPLQIILRGLDVADKSVFSEGAGNPQADNAYALTIRLAVLYAIIGIAFGALMSLFATPILTLAYGTKFAGSEAALIAWVPVYVLLSVTMPFESLVYMWKRFRGYYCIRGVGSLVALALTFPLVSRFSEVGAIASCAAGWFIAVVGTAILLQRGGRP
jgi:O-antigen/teichoic acid export membrane protein